MEATSGGAGHRGAQYAERNRLVREKFDALEAQFDTQVPQLQAAYFAAGGSDEASALLAGFTEQCITRVLGAVEELLHAFDEAR
jgi:hypothetical protein